MQDREINNCLQNLHSLSDIRKLITELGFEYTDSPLSTSSLPEEIRTNIDKASLKIIGKARDFPVIFLQLSKSPEKIKDLDRFLIKFQRALISKLPSEYQIASIVFIASQSFERVHIVNAKLVGKRLILRRYLTGGDHKTRTAAEQIALLHIKREDDWVDIIKKVEDAFDRDAVSAKFFETYYKIFQDYKKLLLTQINDYALAQNFLLSLLNRLMFVYFIQRKEWIADANTEFVKTLWNLYKTSNCKPDTFYSGWLATLFFNAFNNKHGYENIGLPKQVIAWFKTAPYLDGGLFDNNTPFDQAGFHVPDKMFEEIFSKLLDAYNFTVTEDTPFDQNIAVDPEMLGMVYENLVKKYDDSTEQKDAGIVYTQRVEVDFMCRRALVEHLIKHTRAMPEDIYRFVFNDDSDNIVSKFDADTADQIDQALLNLTVVDPACGSGAFLVGMMQVVVELRRGLLMKKGMKLDAFNEFEQRKDIIERSLYGVDVKDWAIAIARLRLWLTLIEVADDKNLDLVSMKLKNEALLPKLQFKLRVGDSLVQEINNEPVPLRADQFELDSNTKSKIKVLHDLKQNYYYNRSNIAEQDVLNAELDLYQSIIDKQVSKLSERIEQIQKQKMVSFQDKLTLIVEQKATVDKAVSQFNEKEEKKIKATLDPLIAQRDALLTIKKNLHQKKYIFWAIEFAEIFYNNGGFDIVIGNPPYVRQEQIADPFILEKGLEPSVEQKRIYKDRLAKMVAADWGKTVSVEKRSDLYVYFYLRGLALLKPSGTFVFITSNSWLDVGFGKSLQEILLRNTRVVAIYDNEAKRSFKNADVNTIIAVIQPLPPESKPDSQHTVRFVMFKKPFEVVVNAYTLEQIARATGRMTISATGNNQPEPLARVVALTNSELYQQGIDPDAASKGNKLKFDTQDVFSNAYDGNKWGGKYLRAPDIYWTILEKGKDKLVRLGDIAEVRRGFTTGANEFFYLQPIQPPKDQTPPQNCVYVKNGAGWQGWIEEEFLKPVIKSPRECKSIVIKPEELKYKIFMCHKPKTELQDTLALQYIQWGETQDYPQRPTCASRKLWWDVGESHTSLLCWSMIQASKHSVFLNCSQLEVDHNLFEITTRNDRKDKILAIFGLSVFGILMKELLGRQYGGGSGPIKTDGTDIAGLTFVNPEVVIHENLIPTLESDFVKLGDINLYEVTTLLTNKPTQSIDNIIFDILGLTSEEREQVYAAVIDLVEKRLKKAKSV